MSDPLLDAAHKKTKREMPVKGIFMRLKHALSGGEATEENLPGPVQGPKEPYEQLTADANAMPDGPARKNLMRTLEGIQEVAKKMSPEEGRDVSAALLRMAKDKQRKDYGD